PEGQLAHLARADHEDLFISEMVEDATDIINSDAGDGDMAAGDTGVGADAPGHLASVAEEGVHEGSGPAEAVGELEGALDLAADLSLADHKAVEAGGNAEEVADGCRLLVAVEVWPNFLGADIVQLRQEVDDVGEAQAIGIRAAIEDASQVKLDTVACAQD